MNLDQIICDFNHAKLLGYLAGRGTTDYGTLKSYCEFTDEGMASLVGELVEGGFVSCGENLNTRLPFLTFIKVKPKRQVKYTVTSSGKAQLMICLKNLHRDLDEGGAI